MRLKQRCSGWQLALLALAADQITKFLVRRVPGRREIVPGLLRVRPVRNTGMAFSMLSGHFWLLTVLTAVIIVWLVAWLIRKPDLPRLMRAGFWMIAGGGLGNLVDRLIFGSVTDFLELEFMRFAVFNVADVFVCVGAALAAVGILIYERDERRRGSGAV